MRSFISSLRLNGADLIIALLVLALIASPFFARPASAGEALLFEEMQVGDCDDIVIACEPMDGVYTADAYTATLIGFEPIESPAPVDHSALIACDIFLGCDGHGDWAAFKPDEQAVLCVVEDILDCYTGLGWNSAFDAISTFASVDVTVTVGDHEPILFQASSLPLVVDNDTSYL